LAVPGLLVMQSVGFNWAVRSSTLISGYRFVEKTAKTSGEISNSNNGPIDVIDISVEDFRSVFPHKVISQHRWSDVLGVDEDRI